MSSRICVAGRAPPTCVIGLRRRRAEPGWRSSCSTPEPPRCPTRRTHGASAELFAELADERDWRSVLAVTANYHLARARTLLARCHPGEVRFEVVDWDDVRFSVWASESAKLWVTCYVQRGC